MAKRRCIQCDKELPPEWSDPSRANLDPICPECALRDLRKKSLRRRRILDTSVRKKTDLEPQPPTVQPQPQTGPSADSKTRALSRTSGRAHLPQEIELDTDDPLLLAAHGQSDLEKEEESKEIPPEEAAKLEETKQIRKPKPPQGPQIKLNF